MRSASSIGSKVPEGILVKPFGNCGRSMLEMGQGNVNKTEEVRVLYTPPLYFMLLGSRQVVKLLDFDSGTRRFKSYLPNHLKEAYEI